ncbi:hypothetical protein PSA7680_01848 [Pseudoruegeria aquimaris]|uniref:Biotin synthesis protein BioG n=1 Tax=Pseudoruegeria aquimaris TaxID=393663 RepID=A0A1Y5SFI3_9RHOB|nr:pimeloyl-ACP methyl esterase BioG family protein [Pseudoruegeria aquimaris]SLN37933.1 hypothetical protein PSA7680_01848 [Pseudoruegeria aquimaris]
MEGTWIRQGGAERVICVFGGWGLGPEAAGGLPCDADLYWLRDYRTLDAALPDFSRYSSRVLVAWSFGVAAYGHWQEGRADGFDTRVALCGSPAPVDRRLGIPPRTYEATQGGLSPESFAAFAGLCHGKPVTPGEVDIAALGEELAAVKARGAAPAVAWDLAVIALQDRIFPPGNLRRAFAGTPIRELDAPHVPFAALSRWEDLLP